MKHTIKVFHDIKKGDLVQLPDVAALMFKADSLPSIYMAKRDLKKDEVIDIEHMGEAIELTDLLYIKEGDKPDENGQYMAYTDDRPGPYGHKTLLTFVNGVWMRSGSDQSFRGKIYAYIGPLPAYEI